MAAKSSWIAGGVFVLLLLASGHGLFADLRAQAAPAVWQDPATGFAIGGYDPVAYHTKRRPVLGREKLQHQWGGAAWRFVTTGNRDAFAKHPEIYVPRFAGYDAYALSKGLTVRGEPVLWVFYRGRLLLFQNRKNLQLWRADPSKVTAAAETNWKRLGRNLPGTSGL